MITKITRIENLGVFPALAGAGKLTFGKLTLIFSPNAGGKTTLVAALKSLGTGNPNYILERRALGALQNPQVEFLIDTTPHVFDGDRWNATCPGISVFDSRFVHDNVHAGFSISREHRSGVYGLVIGEKGVAFAQKVESLKQQIADITKKIHSIKVQIELRAKPLSFDEFMGLTDVGDQLATMLEHIERDLAAVSKQKEIADARALSELAMPSLNPHLSTALNAGIDGLDASTEAAVLLHLDRHTKGCTAEWIERGLSYIGDDVCPFCGLSLSQSHLIALYRGYFSENYRGLKKQIRILLEEVEREFSDLAIEKYTHVVELNRTQTEYWRQFIPSLQPDGFLVSDLQILRDVRAQLTSMLRAKEGAPLESAMQNEEFHESESSLSVLGGKLVDYNGTVRARNAQIEALKATAKSADASRLERERGKLLATKVRYSPDVREFVKQYLELTGEKRRLDQQMDGAKRELDQHCQNMLQSYQKGMNEILNRFGFGFSVCDFDYDYRGAAPATVYKIGMKGHKVPLEPHHVNDPHFGNTLSEGEKNALAFAFFLTSQDQDPSVSEKTIVLDDPISSFDRRRLRPTVESILNLCRRSKQVIVFSHDALFLHSIASSARDPSPVEFQIHYDSSGSSLVEWSSQEEVKSRYFRDIQQLQYFVNSDCCTPDHAQSLIRPALEFSLRARFPNELGTKKNLGEMLGAIRVADTGTRLRRFTDEHYKELDEINTFVCPSQHGQGVSLVQTPDAHEVRSYVNRALAIICS